MNWNAVIRSFEKEAKNCARRASTSSNPEPYKTNELLKMEIYIDFARALAEGMVKEASDKEPIPEGVYYRDCNFYNTKTRISMGHEFMIKWRPRAGEFPGRPDSD